MYRLNDRLVNIVMPSVTAWPWPCDTGLTLLYSDLNTRN